MYTLAVHTEAADDLEQIWDTAEEAAATILALLEEVGSDQGLLDAMTVHDFGAHGTERFHVSKWLSSWNRGLDLWRLKVWALERQGLPYRIVYAYEIGKQRYHVLGIFHRDFNYADSDPRTQRILRAYRELFT